MNEITPERRYSRVISLSFQLSKSGRKLINPAGFVDLDLAVNQGCLAGNFATHWVADVAHPKKKARLNF
jgi:hypothetical protein